MACKGISFIPQTSIWSHSQYAVQIGDSSRVSLTLQFIVLLRDKKSVGHIVCAVRAGIDQFQGSRKGLSCLSARRRSVMLIQS